MGMMSSRESVAAADQHFCSEADLRHFRRRHRIFYFSPASRLTTSDRPRSECKMMRSRHYAPMLLRRFCTSTELIGTRAGAALHAGFNSSSRNRRGK